MSFSNDRYSSAAAAILHHRYGSLPKIGGPRVGLKPAVAAGIDTGTVVLAELPPDPGLTPDAEDGIELGFLEFMRERLR